MNTAPCRCTREWTVPALATALTLGPLLAGTALAFDVNDRLQINGLLAGAFQCQEVSGGAGSDDLCRGGAPFQPEILYKPTDRDQFFAKLGFAAGNGLNPQAPFVLTPWAADLEDDVKDIGGSGRSYLLELWYAHTFKLGSDQRVEVAGGLLDPAVYVNRNAYADNEYTQFMNEAFGSARNVFLPAYVPGGVLVWKAQDWTFTGIGTNAGENEDGEEFNWYAAAADYRLESALGEGNYRLMYAATSRSFLNPAGENQERRSGLSLSFDQELGPIAGAFLRLGRQREDAAVDYKGFYTGGLDFKGAAWGRELDNIGIGYGYLDGGNTELRRTDVCEAYYRFALNDFLALSADVQYMHDSYDDGDDIAGWVFGMRAVAEF